MKIAIPIDFNNKVYKINRAYIDYIVDAKMTPIIITPDNIRMVAECKGVLLPGGIDIDPMYYGMNNTHSYTVNPAKDEFERAVFYRAIKHQLPIFGICRGFQLMMYELLLTCNDKKLPISFIQNIDKHAQTNNLSVNRNIKTHFVNINGSILYNEQKVKRIGVNSMHHQCLVTERNPQKFNPIENDDVSPYVKIIAWTDKIKQTNDIFLIEGIQINLWGNNIVGVQWHPEELKDTKLISHFFEQSYVNKNHNFEFRLKSSAPTTFGL